MASKATDLKRLRIYSKNPKWATIKKQYDKLIGTKGGHVDAPALRKDVITAYKRLRTLYSKDKKVRFTTKVHSVREVPYEERKMRGYRQMEAKAKATRSKDRRETDPKKVKKYVKSRRRANIKEMRKKRYLTSMPIPGNVARKAAKGARKVHYREIEKRLGIKLGPKRKTLPKGHPLYGKGQKPYLHKSLRKLLPPGTRFKPRKTSMDIKKKYNTDKTY